jgi:NAD(P)-dependent dehydrogenase (short-subunit alcohol dehydrogenase family)
MDLGLDGATVLVTGGSAGIGLATARRLLDEGASVAVCARDRRRLAAVETELDDRYPGRVLTVPADVRSRSQVDAWVTQAVDRFGGVDGLVNNAGRSTMSTFATTSDEEWRDELDLKFWSVINPVRAAMDHLARSDRAAIVNVNAILARQPEPRLVATSAARAGVLNLSRSLATELAPIRVNSVCLGLIDTGQWRRRYEAAAMEQTYEAWCRDLARDRGVLLERLGTPEEVAAMVVMLLSPAASFVTGSVLDVGGGVGRYM